MQFLLLGACAPRHAIGTSEVALIDKRKTYV